MANVKLSELTSATQVADANEFEINEAGTSKKVTGTQIKSYVNSGDGALAAKDTVATADIDADAIDGTKIADDSIDSEHIVADSIDAEHYAAGSVDSTAIASDAVGADELNVPGNGTAGQYLASDGDGTMTWTTLAAGGGGFSNVQVFNSSGTWTNPGDVEKVKVTVIGGGGGSSGASPYNNSSGQMPNGGGAGGCAIEWIDIPANTNVPVTVGARGNGGNPGGNAGNAGGASSFGTYCSANGGGGAVSYNVSKGGVGGNATGGTINLKGGQGDGYRLTARRGGFGGDSYLHPGGRYAVQGTNSNQAGTPGTLGSGGGSANWMQPGNNTGRGGTGVVIVEY